MGIKVFCRRAITRIAILSWPIMASAGDGSGTPMWKTCRSSPTWDVLAESSTRPPPQLEACRAFLDDPDHSTKAAFHLGRLLFLMDRPEEAIPLLRSAASREEPEAMTALAVALDGDHLLEQRLPIKEALELYERAASLGDPVGQVLLALAVTADQQSAQRNLQRAMRLLRMAADAGYPVAHWYAHEFHHWHDIPASKETLQEHLHMAAKGGVLDAIETLRLQDQRTEAFPNPRTARYPYVDPHFLALYRPD